jgi:hypothetical protein
MATIDLVSYVSTSTSIDTSSTNEFRSSCNLSSIREVPPTTSKNISLLLFICVHFRSLRFVAVAILSIMRIRTQALHVGDFSNGVNIKMQIFEGTKRAKNFRRHEMGLSYRTHIIGISIACQIFHVGARKCMLTNSLYVWNFSKAHRRARTLYSTAAKKGRVQKHCMF